MIRIITLIGTAWLLGIIWSDLTFDTLGWDTLSSGGVISAHSLAQIEAYYVRTVEMEAGGLPLITLVMLVTVATALWQWRLDIPRWLKLLGTVITLPALAISILKTAPAANAIAAGGITAAEMSGHSHTLLAVHLSLLTALTLYLVAQVAGFALQRK